MFELIKNLQWHAHVRLSKGAYMFFLPARTASLHDDIDMQEYGIFLRLRPHTSLSSLSVLKHHRLNNQLQSVTSTSRDRLSSIQRHLAMPGFK